LIQLADQVKQFEQHDSFVVVMEAGPRRSLKFLQSLVLDWRKIKKII